MLVLWILETWEVVWDPGVGGVLFVVGLMASAPQA